MSEDLLITLVHTLSGQSETLPLPGTRTVQEVAELAVALFGMESSAGGAVACALFKDGRGLKPDLSLVAAGVQNGDLLAAQEAKQHHHQSSSSRQHRPPRTTQRPTATTTAGSNLVGGLDFSSLLSGGGGGGSTAAAAASSTLTGDDAGPPVYYPGMSVEDAMQYNPHPKNFVLLLRSHEHLFKQLRYHNPSLAEKIRNKASLDDAIQIWREEMVKGGIASAVKQTEAYHKQQEMERRKKLNPNDTEAMEYFQTQDRKQKVEQQYIQMMEQYPESLGRVLMLYVEAKINGHAIQAFCDSGAQMTIMSKKVAVQCGLQDLIDTRFSGVASGVGTGKILGRIHIVQLQIGTAHYPCSVSVMDDPPPGASEMPFLLGLDMMKRHLCQIDLQKSVLRFHNPTGGAGHNYPTWEEIPFLHEKDLDTTQGGTKGFDAEKANQELDKLMQQQQEKDGDDDDQAMNDG